MTPIQKRRIVKFGKRITPEPKRQLEATWSWKEHIHVPDSTSEPVVKYYYKKAGKGIIVIDADDNRAVHIEKHWSGLAYVNVLRVDPDASALQLKRQATKLAKELE